MRGTITKYRPNGVVWGTISRKREGAREWAQVTKRGFATKREAEQPLREALIAAGSEGVEEPVAPQACSYLQRAACPIPVRDVTLGTHEAYRKQSRYPSRGFACGPIDTITTEDLQELFQTLRTVGGDTSARAEKSA